MEEALVCPETGTDSVLQVPGETLLPQDCSPQDPTPDAGLCEAGWKRGSVAHSQRAEVW